MIIIIIIKIIIIIAIMIIITTRGHSVEHIPPPNNFSAFLIIWHWQRSEFYG